MKRRPLPLLLAAMALPATMALSSCAADSPAASTPVQTATASATPAPSATSDAGEAAFLKEARMKARTLTPELVDDETLIGLGEAACEDDGGKWQALNARTNQGFSYEEVEAVLAAGKRHLC